MKLAVIIASSLIGLTTVAHAQFIPPPNPGRPGHPGHPGPGYPPPVPIDPNPGYPTPVDPNYPPQPYPGGRLFIDYNKAHDITTRLYNGALMRQADIGGQNFWDQKLTQAQDEQGVRTIVRDFLYNSHEFYQVVGRVGAQRVASSILSSFGHQGWGYELQNLTQQIQSNQADFTVSQLVLEIVNGGHGNPGDYLDLSFQEARDVTSRLYFGALGRNPDFQGERNMTRALEQLRTVRELQTIVQDFLYKFPEFQQHVYQVGAPRVVADMKRAFNNMNTRPDRRSVDLVQRGQADVVLVELIREFVRK